MEFLDCKFDLTIGNLGLGITELRKKIAQHRRLRAAGRRPRPVRHRARPRLAGGRPLPCSRGLALRRWRLASESGGRGDVPGAGGCAAGRLAAGGWGLGPARRDCDGESEENRR